MVPVLVPVLVKGVSLSLSPFIAYLMAVKGGMASRPDNSAIGLHACEEAVRVWREYTKGCVAMILPGSPEGDIMFFLCTEAELDLATTKGLPSQCKCTVRKWHYLLSMLTSLGQKLSQVIRCEFKHTNGYGERPMPIICVATCETPQSASTERQCKAKNVVKRWVPDRVWLQCSVAAAHLPPKTNPGKTAEKSVRENVWMQPTHTASRGKGRSHSREAGQDMIYEGVEWERKDDVGDQQRKVDVHGEERPLVLSGTAGKPVKMLEVIKIIHKNMLEMNNADYVDKYKWKDSQAPFLQVRPGPRRVATCGTDWGIIGHGPGLLAQPRDRAPPPEPVHAGAQEEGRRLQLHRAQG